ncbi:MAG TPA: hypothetical protein VGC37_13920 [Friedmanniella sp.]
MRAHPSRTSALLVGLVLLGTAITAAPAAAAASGPACGSTLTVDTTLVRDLRCHGDGLTLARGVSLDLGGHELSGDGTGRAVVVLGNADAAVRHGRIEHWAAGVVVLGQESSAAGPALTLERVNLHRAPSSVDEASVTLSASTLTRADLSVVDSYLTVVRSRVDRSDIDVAGVLQLDHVRLTRSAIDADSGTVHLTDSVLDGHGRDIAPISCGDGEHTILRSTVKRFGRPMDALESCTATVQDSTFSRNAHGVFVSPLSPSSRTGQILTVSSSTFDHDATAITGQGFVVNTSTFTRNRTGIRTDGPANVYSSAFRHNSRDGLHASAGSVLLQDDLAVHNHRYGLYAPGSLDEGGNRAHDNGKADCVGVACTP